MHLCFLHPVVVPMSIDSLKSINLTVIENDVSVRVRIKFATKGEGGRGLRFSTRILAQFRDVVESSVDNHGPTIIIM